MSELPSYLYTDVDKNGEDPSFKEHRHDQSLASVYRKLHGSIVLKIR